jgi:outer membrane lipoprotein-sorting protein
MTRCNYVEGRLRAHIDQELSTLERKQVELHLESCAACQRQFRRLESVVRAARSIPHPDAPPHFSANLQLRLAALRAARHPKPWWRRIAKPALRPLRVRWTAAGAVAALAGILLAFSLWSNPRPGAAEIARKAEFSWSKVRNYSCELVTRGVYLGDIRDFRQRTWFSKPGLYRFETEQDYPLVTVVDANSVRHYIEGGDWRGRGPLVIVRPRVENQEELPFPFGITWPAASNVTVDSLIRQLQQTRDAELTGTQKVLGAECYRLRFQATPAGGRRLEDCTMWVAQDSLLPLRIHRRRDADNDMVTEAVNLRFNTELPSMVFDLRPEQGAVVIHGDVDPHVFALKPERSVWFDRRPLRATQHEVAALARALPFPAMLPGYLPRNYRLVRVRRAVGRWMDIHWIDEHSPLAARVMRLVEQSGGVEDPPELRGGTRVRFATADGAVTAWLRQGSEPYPHCYVSWRQGGALLTLSTTEISLEETLRIARSMRVAPREVPPLGRAFVGPLLPAGGAGTEPPPSEASPPSTAPEEAELASPSDPPMVPETAEDENARRQLRPGR